METPHSEPTVTEPKTDAWYKQWWGVIIVIFILPFFIVWYVWAKSKLSTPAKIIVTVLVLGALGSTGTATNRNTSESVNPLNQTNQSNATDKPVTPASNNAYEVVRQWDLNGGYGMLVVIANTQPTQASLQELGNRLRADFAANDTSFVHVYTSKDAALIYRDQSLQANTSQEIIDKHSKHYVAQYFKNNYTGINKFTILAGAIGNPTAIEVNY